VRSMMGDFQGNVGLLTADYNRETERTQTPLFVSDWESGNSSTLPARSWSSIGGGRCTSGTSSLRSG
jgi:hypothetical protein